MSLLSKTIICFGDSNTHGYNALTNGRFKENERWPRLLGQFLGEGYSVVEEGLSGRTTVFPDPLFEGMDGLSYLYPCLMSHEPVDLLIIMLGTNDVKERFRATPENITKGLERLIQKALCSRDVWRSDPQILVIAPPPIGDAYEHTDIGGEMGTGCAAKSRRLASFYANASQHYGCHFLDAASIPGVEMHPCDHMHLGLESHRLLAEELARLVPTYLPFEFLNTAGQQDKCNYHTEKSNYRTEK